MHASVLKMSHFAYKGRVIDLLYLITDRHQAPPILPLMYTTYLSRFGVVYESHEFRDSESGRRSARLVERHVSDATIRAYIYTLANFLSYLEECKESLQTPGMHVSDACSHRFVMHYLNEVLAKSLDSQQSLQVHCSSINAYYNWLDYMGIKPHINLSVYRKTRQHMASKSQAPHYIKYVTRHWRLNLLNACETLGEKLMMRMGFEVGLRTCEVVGLRVNGKGKLADLFNRLGDSRFDQCDRFSYCLDGMHTKGSRSRLIYFDRDLLADMERYFRTERQWLLDLTGIQDDSFFLRTDRRFTGTSIGDEQASRVFRKRARQAGLNPLLSFHDLRHTFATELFHEELSGPDGRETRSESAALIVTAQRLGHSFTRSGQAPPTTTRYIRMRLQMMELEN